MYEMVVHYKAGWVRKWTGGAVAICFGRHVFTDEAHLPPHTLAHEECHVAQYEVFGFWGYLVRWFYWTWKLGYLRNPFEEQARTYANWKCPPVVIDPYLSDVVRWFTTDEIGELDWWPY